MKLGGLYAVHLHHDGVLHSFLPGDELPSWAAKRIDNPLTREATPTPTEEHEPEPTGGMPAKTGPGATRQAWEDYATSQGIEVDPDWKREDIIAAVEAAS